MLLIQKPLRNNFLFFNSNIAQGYGSGIQHLPCSVGFQCVLGGSVEVCMQNI